MNRTVLIVDDSEADRYIVNRVLTKSNLFGHIYSLNDGEEAYEHFKNSEESKKQMGDDFPPRLVLLDINMPRMTGFEFLEKYSALKNKMSSETLFVAMLTSSESKQDFETAKKFTFVEEFLKKPFTKDHALSLAKLLEKRSPELHG